MVKSQLLILGNGFDVHCGLKSTYKDFFRSEILDTTVISFGRKQLQSGVLGFWEHLLIEYYKCNNEDNYNWCDIEAIIKDTLWKLFIKSNLSDSGLWAYVLESVKENKDLNDQISSVNSVEKYLIKCCKSFIHEYQNRYDSVNDLIKFFIQNLYLELQKLEKGFCKYLKNDIKNSNDETVLNKNYLINAINLIAKLTGFTNKKFKDIKSFTLENINNSNERENPSIYYGSKNFLHESFERLKYTSILSFNYTALFDILDIKCCCAYINVHGKLCKEECNKECTKSNIIFGIDDSLIQSQGTNSELRLFSKTYRKMLNADKYLSFLPSKEGNFIAIKFYGHSLSEADYSYFQSIFDYYDIYENSLVSLIFYYSKNFENHDAVYRLISEYGKTLTNKDQGKNLIHKLLLENRLHIQELKDEIL